MKKIFVESFHCFIASFPALLGFSAVMETTLLWTGPSFVGSVAFGVAMIYLAYAFHRYFLYDERLSFLKAQESNPNAPSVRTGWFVLASAGLALVPLAISFTVVFGTFVRPSAVGVLLVCLPVYLLALSLFGTLLPANVAHDGTYRLMQGLRATFSTMWRLVLGPGVVGFVLIYVSLRLEVALAAMRVPSDSLVMLAFSIVVRSFGFLTTILAVAVLCEMYRRTRPETASSSDSGLADQTAA